MPITANLTDFPLLELFQFIEKGSRSGLLSFYIGPPLYIWFEQGEIVAAANRLDRQGLVSLIKQQQWVSERVFNKLVHWDCPINEPMGLWLANQGVLKPSPVKVG